MCDRFYTNRVQPVVGIEMRWRCNEAILIENAMADQPWRVTDVAQYFGDGPTKATEHVVLLD